MSVSGSNDFNQNENTIIRDALILVGGLEDDEIPSAAQETYARRALNRMVKAWSAKGLKTWCWNEVTVTFVTDQIEYEVGPTAPTIVDEHIIEMANVRKIIDGGDETPMRMISRAEYMNLPKNNSGEPVAVYFERRLDNAVLYVWPKPDANADTMKFSTKQYIEDFDQASNNPYFPLEWIEAIVYNLAVRLAPKYEVRGADLQLLTNMAIGFLNEAEYSDMPQDSLYLGPERQY